MNFFVDDVPYHYGPHVYWFGKNSGTAFIPTFRIVYFMEFFNLDFHGKMFTYPDSRVLVALLV